jgi:hypothetical protein
MWVISHWVCGFAYTAFLVAGFAGLTGYDINIYYLEFLSIPHGISSFAFTIHRNPALPSYEEHMPNNGESTIHSPDLLVFMEEFCAILIVGSVFSGILN